MSKQARSMMIIVGILVSSIGCVQFSHRQSRPSVQNFSAGTPMTLAETQFRYKSETLKLDQFVRKELLSQEALPEFYLQAFEKMQKMELKDLTSFQEFSRLQNSLSGYHAQRLALGLKARQKSPLQMHRFLADLKRHEDTVAELQAQSFTLLQQKQQHQVAFLFATDAP